MPLRLAEIRGKPSMVRLRRLGASKTPPTPSTVVVDANAAAGANSLTVEALTAAVPKNTVLRFETSGGDVVVVVTADANVGATTLAVESFEGKAGDGISGAIAVDDDATYDGLYVDFASEDLRFAKASTSNPLSAVTHGSSTGVNVRKTEVTEIAPAITRTGLLARGPLLQDILRYGDSNDYWWAKLIVADENANEWITLEGLAKITGVGLEAPANNLVRLPYTINFEEEPVPTFAA
jgi:hypothetical protein